MTEVHSHERNPLLSETPHEWQWFVGMARMGVLLLAGGGAVRLVPHDGLAYVLLALFAFGLFTNLLYLLSVKRIRSVPGLLTWTQILVDFAIVSFLLAMTGGIWSSYVFFLVIVILEAGLLLGLVQGFLFATLAALFMGLQAAMPAPPAPHTTGEWVEIWYRFLIQGLAFYLTAFISGYWNQRITHMEQFQRRILDNMNSGFLMTDPKGYVTVLNHAAEEIIGISESSAVGRPVQEVLRAAPGGECPVLTALRSHTNYTSYEFVAVVGPNETKVLGLSTSHIDDRRGRLTDMIVSFKDLTEVARMRQELQSQDRLAAVGELSAGLAHEIRNPVAAIRGAVDELPASLDNPRIAEKLAAIAKRESDHLNNIVTGFLDFARNPTVKRTAFDLRVVVTEVKEAMERENPAAASLKIVAQLPDSPCEISGDPSQIRQVFTNLAKNGIEAMEHQGTLSIILTRTSGSYDVRFEDEGPGISPDKINKIFEPFYSTKEKGVGMGLAVCMRIITAHDGVLRAASRTGGGATMTVRLPAA